MNRQGSVRAMEHGREPSAEVRPGEGRWRVTAAPFFHAARLRAFIVAIDRTEGVSELVAERFRGGEIALSLCYAGTAPLAGRLAALPGFRPVVEAASGGAIRLALDDEREDD